MFERTAENTGKTTAGIEGHNYTDVTLSKKIGEEVVTVHVNTVSTNKTRRKR